jgi:glycosyltransferase involved in cell wall biosynthesis
MKILHVLENLGTGGVQKLAIVLAGGFPGSTLVSFNRENTGAFPELRRHYHVAHTLIDNEVDIDQCMKEFDICHFHCWQPPFAEKIQWDRISDKSYPTLITLHETKPCPFTLPGTVICICERQASWQHVPVFAVIPNGFDLGGYVYPRQYNNHGVLRIGFASRLDEKLESDAPRLMHEALRLVTQPYEIVVIGDGPYQDRYTQGFHKYGIPARFLGRRWDMDTALRELDLFLYPTEHDVLPSVLIEAMASGLPIVSPPIGAIPDLLGAGRGFAVDWHDMPELLAELTDDLGMRYRVGKQAQAYVLDVHSHKRMVESYCQVYGRMR